MTTAKKIATLTLILVAMVVGTAFIANRDDPIGQACGPAAGYLLDRGALGRDHANLIVSWLSVICKPGDILPIPTSNLDDWVPWVCDFSKAMPVSNGHLYCVFSGARRTRALPPSLEQALTTAGLPPGRHAWPW